MGLVEIVLILGDILLSITALMLAMFLHIGSVGLGWQQMDPSTLISAGLFAFITLFSSHLMEVYDVDRNTMAREIATNILFGVATSFAFLSVVFYLKPDLMLGRGVLVGSLLIYLIFQICWHSFCLLNRNDLLFPRRVLILGTGALARQMGELVTANRKNLLLVGYTSCRSDVANGARVYAHEGCAVPAGLIRGNEEDLSKTATQTKADLIVVALAERRGFFPLGEVLRCKLTGITIMDAPSFYEFVTGRLLLESITPSWLIFSAGFRKNTIFSMIKRVIDVLFALIGLMTTSVFFPVIALAIKFDSPGPVFFRQQRVGQGERLFTLVKFRTMCQDAEAASGAVWAQKNDSRITRLGKFLRGSRIDEIPQLINVLKGEMSLIGPRPERYEFVEKLKLVIPYYSKRHFIKPGLTGWAQVRYPYGSSVEDAVEKLRYDLYYTKNKSPFLDTLIFLETIKVVLFGRGGR